MMNLMQSLGLNPAMDTRNVIVRDRYFHTIPGFLKEKCL